MEREARIHRQGGSYLVTLPSDWIKANGMELDGTCRMDYEDGTVTIRPAAGKGRKRA
jgi:antitoxin component of MazEF toxin-antitoxin module